MNRRRRKGRGNPQNAPFNWNAVMVALGIMMFWVLLLVWFRKNEVRYVLLEDAMPFLMIVAGVSFSFGWKTISDEIALAYPGGRWSVYYWIGLLSPYLALGAWVLAALALQYVGL